MDFPNRIAVEAIEIGQSSSFLEPPKFAVGSRVPQGHPGFSRVISSANDSELLHRGDYDNVFR
jgi:hypothetical protein